MASGMLDTDSEDELPAGWEERVTDEGQVYYASHLSQKTQWDHPLTGRKKLVLSEMPYGWEKRVNNVGETIYINNITQKTTSTDPRLAYATDEKESSGEIRQRFDASTNALQVLQGRDLGGMYAVVTGANSGIGFETARALALHGAHVILACRNMKRAREAVKVIQMERPAAKVEAMFIDLTSLKTVEQFASNYIKRQIPLNVLILNAGVFSMPFSLTDDQYETTFQTNHLGHFHMTKLLLDILLKSSPSRVVVVSAECHRFTDLNERTISEALLSSNREVYRPIFAYNQSKMCNILFMLELHRRYAECGIHCFAIHPGNVVASNLSRHWWLWRIIFTAVRPFSKSLAQAAATSVYCASARDLDNVSGYYFNNCFQCSPAPEALNVNTARRLWELSEAMTAKARTLCFVHPTAFDV